MDFGIISSRYARALLSFAIENKEAEVVYAEMQQLGQLFLQMPQLQQTLQNPVVSNEQKLKLLIAASTIKDAISVSTKRFAQLIIEKRRCDMMQFVASSFVVLYRKHCGITKSRFIVPAPVSEQTLSRMKAMVQRVVNGQVEFETVIDASIGGGFVLEYDTYRVDASLKTQLQKISKGIS
jgi:F-type H+-transporting ATPase subunit delta